MFIVLNWFYLLDSLSAANVLFIYSAMWSRGEARRGPGGRSPPEAGAFFKVQPEIKGQVKMRGIIWCHWWRFLLQCTPALCCFSVMLHSPLNPPLLLTYLYQLLNFRVFFFTIYCCQSVPCTAEIVCCAVYRLFSQILDAGTTASRRQRFFHCQRKVHALLICCKEHLTADSCLLWYRL